VATDSKSRLLAEEPGAAPSAIENELPTYRAISSRAVFSLLCGILASFSFAHLYFLGFAVLAVVLGVLANRAITRYPDILTGRRLANAGIATGLIFGLVAFTYTSVQGFILKREAARFGREYAEKFQNGTLGDLLWLSIHPETRKSKTPDDAVKEYEATKTKERMMVDQKMAPLHSLRKRLASTKDQQFHFVDIENQGMDETRSSSIGYFATAIFEVEGSTSKEFPEAKQYALAIFKGMQKGRHYEWWVEDVHFPYQPRSYVAPQKPVDDGHDHGSH
jgi:hypothetical protein